MLTEDSDDGRGSNSSTRRLTRGLSKRESSFLAKAAPGEETRLQCLGRWFRKNRVQLSTKCRIIVSTYQIVVAAAGVLDVQMPKSFTSFIDIASFFNLDVAEALPFGCSSSYTFIEKLILTTMVPLGLGSFLVLFFVMEYMYYRKKIQANTARKRGDKSRKFNEVKDKYMSYFFYLTYLVLPSVTTTIFQIFPCVNLDPYNEDGSGSDLYLRADLDISCTSDYYYDGVAYASIMIIIYPIGIPLLYFYFLYNSRVSIAQRITSVVDGTKDNLMLVEDSSSLAEGRPTGSSVEGRPTEELEDATGRATISMPKSDAVQAARVSFLWESYKPKYWYWEVIETTRRLMLTSILSVISPGTSSQELLAILLSLGYWKWYSSYSPYLRVNDNFLAEIGQAQVFLTFYGALVITKDLMGEDTNVLVGSSLIIANASLIACSVFFALRISAKRIRENRNNYAIELANLNVPEQKDVASPIHGMDDFDSDEEPDFYDVENLKGGYSKTVIPSTGTIEVTKDQSVELVGEKVTVNSSIGAASKDVEDVEEENSGGSDIAPDRTVGDNDITVTVLSSTEEPP